MVLLSSMQSTNKPPPPASVSLASRPCLAYSICTAYLRVVFLVFASRLCWQCVEEDPSAVRAVTLLERLRLFGLGQLEPSLLVCKHASPVTPLASFGARIAAVLGCVWCASSCCSPRPQARDTDCFLCGRNAIVALCSVLLSCHRLLSLAGRSGPLSDSASCDILTRDTSQTVSASLPHDSGCTQQLLTCCVFWYDLTLVCF